MVQKLEKSKIAIIILNYNSWEDTIAEIDLCYGLLNVQYEDIIVVDNASPNNSAQMLHEASISRGFHFIESSCNKGYAAGNNIGLQYAYEHSYRYGWILNNDIVIEDKEIVQKLFDVFQKDASIAVVNPDIYAPNGHMYNRDSKRPTFFDYTIGINKYRKIGRQIHDLGNYGYIYRPQGCCMMVDLEKMHEIDFMDENTFLYVEEPILAERLLIKGYRCACCLNAKIIHNHSSTVKSVFAKRKIRQFNNKSFRYYLEEYREFNRVQIAICCFFNSVKLMFLGQ